MKQFQNLTELRQQVGQELGVSAWTTLSQAQINAFADATGDHQWIHINPERALADSPFGATIAHGFLTLSLAPQLMAEVYSIASVKMGVNYGANRVRFMAPVPAGSRIRLRIILKEVEEMAPDGVRATMECTFEREGSEKPACVAELITLLFE